METNIPNMRRVIVVGGTGFLGYHTILEFLKNGWEATALGLPPAPPDGFFPPTVKIVTLDLEAASDKELLDLLQGHNALIYSAGMDDRSIPKKPAYAKFFHANVEIPIRILRLAKQTGVNHAVVFGSYFAYFHRRWPEMKLAEFHPYIRSRIEQEKAVTAIPGMHVNVLELPYIFGSLPIPGWKPLWLPLVKYLRLAPLVFYMRGGTACTSVATVGKASYCAVERGSASTCSPIGQENLTWKQMLTRLARADGQTIKVVSLPSWMIKIGMLGVLFIHKLHGKESGLNLRYFTALQTAETYLDPEPSQKVLGYKLDNLDDSFKATAAACK